MNRFISVFFVVIIYFLTVATVLAQVDNPAKADILEKKMQDTVGIQIDTTDTAPQKLDEPVKAALLSAVLPGLGQAYNGSYWKIPVIFSGFAIFAASINYFDYYYIEFRNASVALNNPEIDHPYEEFVNQESITRRIDFYRRNRDYLMILGTVFYFLNIVEAHVDAHLQSFDISDELSLDFGPAIQPVALNYQLGLSFKLLIK